MGTTMASGLLCVKMGRVTSMIKSSRVRGGVPPRWELRETCQTHQKLVVQYDFHEASRRC